MSAVAFGSGYILSPYIPIYTTTTIFIDDFVRRRFNIIDKTFNQKVSNIPRDDRRNNRGLLD